MQKPHIQLRTLFIPLVLTFSLSGMGGCSSVPESSPTPYYSAKTEGAYGYSSVQLSDNEYRIMYRATEATDAANVQQYTLYRAAEIAEALNYSWLAVVKTDIERKEIMGKKVVRDTKNVRPNVITDSQCTMSGCNEPGQMPVATVQNTVETMPMKDVYYSIVVRLGNDEKTTGNRAISVKKILQTPPST